MAKDQNQKEEIITYIEKFSNSSLKDILHDDAFKELFLDLISSRESENLIFIKNLIGSQINTYVKHFQNKIYKFLKNLAEINFLEAINLFKSIIFHHGHKFYVKESATESFIDILRGHEEYFENLITLFNKPIRWGIRRIILQDMKYKTDDRLIDFYMNILERIGNDIDFNFGVKYDLWINIFELFERSKENIDDLFSEDRIQILKKAIIKETSENLILGYSGYNWHGKGQGVLYYWIEMARSFNQLYSSLINHEKTYIVKEIISEIKTISESERISFIKKLIFYIQDYGFNKKKERINAVLKTIYKDLELFNTHDIIQFLVDNDLQWTTLYPKAILTRETQEPYLSVKFGIVGKEKVGKSCIAYYLKNLQENPDRRTTYGLDLFKINFPEDVLSKSQLGVKEKANLSIKLYDFGGQKFFWAAHKFFFEKIKAFLVIFTSLDDNSIPIALDWLEKIENYYIIKPKIFLVKNYHDMSKNLPSSQSLSLLQDASEIESIYEVCASSRENPNEIGEGFDVLREDIFTKIEWNTIQEFDITPEMIEIINCIKNKIVGSSFYIFKEELFEFLTTDLNRYSNEKLNEELTKSLIKLEDEGDIIIYNDFIVLSPSHFSQFISKACQIAQENYGILPDNDLYSNDFYQILPENLGIPQKKKIVENIINILINKESCIPDFIDNENVLIFFEDIREEFPIDDIQSKKIDSIKWTIYNTLLKKGDWERLVARISITPGFQFIKIWKGALKVKFKNQSVIIRKIEILRSINKFAIEILINGKYASLINSSIDKLIKDILMEEFLDEDAIEIDGGYYKGRYQCKCQTCQKNIEIKDWIVPYLSEISEIQCQECYKMVSFELMELERIDTSKILEMNLYQYTQRFHDFFIVETGESLDRSLLEYIDHSFNIIRNYWLFEEINCIKDTLKKLLTSHKVILRGDALALPKILSITKVENEDYEKYLKTRGKGKEKLRGIVNSFKEKIKLKSLLKINFYCLKCNKEYPFILILRNNPKYLKYIKFGISLFLRMGNLSGDIVNWDLLNGISEDIKDLIDLEEKLADRNYIEPFFFSNLPEKERHLLIQSFEGIDHPSGLLEIFPNVVIESGDYFLTCQDCQFIT